jgi:hypothetical protein
MAATKSACEEPSSVNCFRYVGYFGVNCRLVLSDLRLLRLKFFYERKKWVGFGAGRLTD